MPKFAVSTRLPAALFVTGIVALAFNLRTAVTSVPPVFPELAASLRLSTSLIAVLAAAPVLCFGAFSPAAAPMARRFGEERVLLGALAALVAGLALRALFPAWLLLPGTVLAAAAIAIMNVLLPSLVKRRRPAQAGLYIGIYLLGLSAGGILGSLVAVPLWQATGGSVVVVLGIWVVPALLAALAWLPQGRYRPSPLPGPASAVLDSGGPGSPGPARPEPVPNGTAGEPAGARQAAPAPGSPSRVWRHRLAWQVMGFMGLQSLTYYATLSWLPVLFRDRGTGAVLAGTLLASMNVGGAVTGLAVPVLAHRRRDQRALTVWAVGVSAAGLAGAWFAPVGTVLAWTVMLGLGQGAALALALYFTTARTRDPAAAARLSGFSQGAGYIVATSGPLVVGFLHSATGNWTVPVVLLLVVYAGEAATGWYAGRDETLPAGGPEEPCEPLAASRPVTDNSL